MNCRVQWLVDWIKKGTCMCEMSFHVHMGSLIIGGQNQPSFKSPLKDQYLLIAKKNFQWIKKRDLLQTLLIIFKTQKQVCRKLIYCKLVCDKELGFSFLDFNNCVQFGLIGSWKIELNKKDLSCLNRTPKVVKLENYFVTTLKKI